MNEINDITIIGAGPVGLFCIFQAGSLGLKVNVIETLPIIGGQCASLYPDKLIYDIPGYPKITGGELIKNLEEQGRVFNPTFYLNQRAISFTKNSNIFCVTTSTNNKIYSKSVIIAAGGGSLEPNRLPIAPDLENERVFYSIKDVNMFKSKRILIAGGGDSAIDWALMFSCESKVSLIHRRNEFKALPSNVESIFKLIQQNIIKAHVPFQIKNIEKLVLKDKTYNGCVDKAHGEINGGIEENKCEQLLVTIENILTNELQQVEVDYILPFYGLKKDLMEIKYWREEFLKDEILKGNNFLDRDNSLPKEFLNKEGNIVVEQSTMLTNIGVYAVGDISYYENKLNLILSGFSEAATACHHIYRAIHNKRPKTQYSTSNPLFKD